MDDSAVDRAIISRIVTKYNEDIEIVESKTGLDVMEHIKNNDIMMCILDLRMPGVDGVEILKTMKLDNKAKDIPVIVCTGLMESQVLQQVLKLGAYDYFTKPFTEEAMKYSLPLKVRNAIDFKRRTDEILLLSQTDDLTRLYNRAYFKMILDSIETLNLNFPLAMVMVDINGLKLVNDAYGSSTGDLFLKKTAEIVQGTFPDTAVCARWGGDEFIGLYSLNDYKDLGHLVKTLKHKAMAIQIEGIPINLAIGYAIMNQPSLEAHRIMNNAEDAMIHDKILDSESIRSTMIGTILHTLNVKNPREEEHSRRVSELCEQMGRAMNLKDQEIQDLKVIGLLHDIGKIAIDEKILNKPSGLSDEEYAEIQKHPEIGYRILSASKEMDAYLEVILHHHERMDGRGYPNGLKGDQIPLFSRILTVIDSFDAMTCYRPYRKTKTAVEAVNELKRCAGSQFDEKLVQIFAQKVMGFNTEKA